MAGYFQIYVIGEPGGIFGADGVNPIKFMILVGNSDRQWLEPVYVDNAIVPIGNLRVIIPASANAPNSLMDACIAFCPEHFRTCPSLEKVCKLLKGIDCLDFNLSPEQIPSDWYSLRKEAKPLFNTMKIWQADLVQVKGI